MQITGFGRSDWTAETGSYAENNDQSTGAGHVDTLRKQEQSSTDYVKQ